MKILIYNVFNLDMKKKKLKPIILLEIIKNDCF